VSSTTTKEEMYRQCVLHDGDARRYREYVAWIPSGKARVGAVLKIEGVPGEWRVVSAGEPRAASIVAAYDDHARKGLNDGHGPSAPMRDAQDRYARDWSRGRR